MRISSFAMALAAVMAAAPCGSAQQPAESAYLAARDSAIRSLHARVEGGEQYPKYMLPHDSALKSLGVRLGAIIGPVRARGFSTPPRVNLENLFPEDLGFGKLDALVYRGDDGGRTLWVTTRPLVSAWLAGKGAEMPHDVRAALRRPEFYTEAIESDAAVYPYATVSLSDSQRLGVATAMMISVGQDESRLPPDELLVTVVRGARVYIVTAPVASAIPAPRRCTALRDDAGFRACYGAHVPSEPGFARIIAQVHALVAELPTVPPPTRHHRRISLSRRSIPSASASIK